MAVKLDIYNRALGLLGCRRIATLAEDREPTRALDSVWATVLDACLRQGMWLFAMRTGAPTATSAPGGVTFGFTNFFLRPSDCIFTYSVSITVNFKPPLAFSDYVEADGVYACNSGTLFTRYTSNGTSFGGDLTRWGTTFAEYVAHYLAANVGYRLTRNTDLVTLLFARSAELMLEARLQEAVLASTGPLAYNARARREFAAGDNVVEPFPFAVAAEAKNAVSS